MPAQKKRRVLLTRENNESLASALSAKGVGVLEIPLIRTVHEAQDEDVADIMREMGSYDWITFSSANGVRGFFREFFKNFDDIRSLGIARIACVGEATAEEVRRLHLRPDVVPAVSTALAMADAMAEYETLDNLKVLCVQGSLSLPDLPKALDQKHRAIVDTAVVYKTEKLAVDGNSKDVAGFKKYGADLLRLWAGSADYHVDVRCSDAIFKQLSQNYLKFRNTARYCLGNLAGFDPDHLVAPQDMLELDRWAVTKLNELIRTAFEAYDNYEFHVLTHAINDFCVVELSSFYLDILKDRLYCESRNGLKRRSAQTALYLIVDAMARMFAPILPFTCDEIWQAMPHRAGDDVRNVVLNEMVQPYEAYALDAEAMARWDTLIALRSDVNGVLEQARADKRIGKALEAHVALCARDEAAAKALETVKDMDLTALLLVSDVILTDDDPDAANVTGSGTAFPGLRIEVRNAEGVKCPRCWMHSTKANADGLCPRCAAVMAELDLGNL